MKVEVDLDYDQVDGLVREALVESYDLHLQEVINFKDRIDPPEHVLKDVKYSKKILKALRRVIKHFSTPQQWEEFTQQYGE